MPSAKLHHALDGAPFGATSKSFTIVPGGRSWPTCRHCGSTIYPQRRVSSKVRTIGGAPLTVEKYRCRCGKGQEIRRPLEERRAA